MISREPGRAQTAATPSNTEQTVLLNPFSVTATQGNGYLATDSATATRVGSLIQNTPMAISIVTRDMIDDIGAVNLNTAVKYSGVIQDINFANPGDTNEGDADFTIRGLEGNAVFRDGFSGLGITDSANIDRVEIVKGPASVFYGNASPGGLINYVTRQPNTNPSAYIDYSYGSYDYNRAELDYNQPLTSDNSVLFRLDASVVDASSFRQFQTTETQFVAPILTWRIAQETTITSGFEYLHQDSVEPAAIPEYTINGSQLVSLYNQLPRDFNPGGSNAVDVENKWTSTTILDHAFSSNIDARLGFNIFNVKDNQIRVSDGVGSNPASVAYTPQQQYQDDTRYDIRNDWVASFPTGFLNHKLIAGAEYSQDDVFFEQYNGSPTHIDPFTVDSEPASYFDTAFPAFSHASYPTLASLTRGVTDVTSGYLSDIVSAFGDRFTALIGGRYDNISVTNVLSGISASGSQFSPQASALVNVADGIGVYASYSTSLHPNALAADNQLYAPERGFGQEAGFKIDLLKNRLVGTVSIFQDTRKNVVNPVYITLPSGVSQLTTAAAGAQRSRGVDTDWTLTLTDEWQMVINYENYNAITTVGQAGSSPTAPSPTQGQPLLRAPRQQGSVWSKYSFAQIKGLSVGIGYSYLDTLVIKSGPFGTIPYYLLEWAPPVEHIDAYVGYSFKAFNHPISLSLNGTNLTNKLDIAAQSFAVTDSPPLYLVGKVTVKF